MLNVNDCYACSKENVFNIIVVIGSMFLSSIDVLLQRILQSFSGL